MILILVAVKEELSKKDLPNIQIHYTGVGKINAAIKTFKVIKNYAPSLIINYGTAGSIAGAGLKSASNVLSGNPVQKRTMSAGVDLFDIVKGKLLDEGLTEEECLDVMLTLTLEEINEVIQLDEVSAGLLMKAAKAAEVARGKAAVMGNKALAVKKMGQGEKFYKGAVAKRKAAGQMGAGYKEGM